MVTTNDYTLAGTHTVNLIVGFENIDFKMTLTETFTVVLLHPCKKTAIFTA
jgi:PKD repeat protein